MNGPLLSVEDLRVTIPNERRVVRAVCGVSFSLDRGKTLALVGESGCGKSMLCRALLGVAASEGQVIFDEVDFAALSAKEAMRLRGRRIGIVLQDPLSALNPVMTVGAQIVEPMRLHLKVSRSEARERAVRLLESLHLPNPVERLAAYPHQLSGGMRQRVAIAIALACDPDLLVADEPTTALDVTVQAEILDLLAGLQRERRMAMILVTHDIGVVAGRADETAVMYAGKIVEHAPTAELFRSPKMPYTRALLDAVPRITDPPHRELAAIPGGPPDPAAARRGCSFAPRCPHATPRCTCDEPQLVEVSGITLSAGGRGGRHRYACHYPLGEEAPS